MASFSGRETIHSGHFMTSNPHKEPTNDEEDEDVEVDVVEDEEKGVEGDPHGAGGSNKIPGVATDEKPVTFYKFGPQKTQSIAIDVSLNKLNKCIKVAYNKMTTPKWKDFKGLRLHWKQRIRLNNVIWRAYHMEFGYSRKDRKKKSPYCYFAVPDDDKTHTQVEDIQGSILEGMYWKRRIHAVCAQYKRWRHFSKKHPHLTASLHANSVTEMSPSTGGKGRKRGLGSEGLRASCDRDRPFGEPPPKSQTPKNTSTEYFDMDEFENEFTDTLFDSLKEPYMFPNPKEMMQNGNADIMQPGLLSLQPSLEEIMASLIGDDSQDDFIFAGPSSSHAPLQASSSHSGHLTSPPPPPPPQQMRSTEEVPSTRGTPSTDYSAKEYLAANMLVDYSQQRSPSVPSRHALSSPMLTSQTSYSKAIYAVPSTAAWKPSHPLQNNFLVTSNGESGGCNMDYIPQFLSSQPPFPSMTVRSSAALSPHLAAISSPNSFLSSSTSSRWWFEPPNLHSGHLQTPVTRMEAALPPVTRMEAALPASLVARPTAALAEVVKPPSISSAPSQQVTTDPLAFPRQTLSDRLGNRSAGKGRRRGEWSSPSSSLPIVTPSTTQSPAKNPWETEDPCQQNPFPSRVDPKEELPEESVVREESIKEEQETSSQPASHPHSSTSTRQRGNKVPADSTLHPTERKRILHLHAEQSRRSALKDGFEQLMEIVPDVKSGGVKPTNAVVLAKAAEHIKNLQRKKDKNRDKSAEFQSLIHQLNEKISSLQSSLPASKRHSNGKVEQKKGLEQFFQRYTKEKTKEDWRFWLMARLLQPIVQSYADFMQSKGENKSPEELFALVSQWMAENWQVAKMRPLASSVLVYIATSTKFLSEPDSLQQHIEEEIN